MKTSIEPYFKPHESQPDVFLRIGTDVSYRHINVGFVLALATIGAVSICSSQVTVTSSTMLDFRKTPLPSNCVIETIVARDDKKVAITFGFNPIPREAK